METIRLVSKVTNPDVIYGGWEAETASESVAKHAVFIRHQNYAIIPSDFEAFVCQESGDVEKAKCFPGFSGNENSS